jgi:hypothetical protein
MSFKYDHKYLAIQLILAAWSMTELSPPNSFSTGFDLITDFHVVGRWCGFHQDWSHHVIAM